MIATSTMSIRWMVIWARVASPRGAVKRQKPRGLAFASRLLSILDPARGSAPVRSVAARPGDSFPAPAGAGSARAAAAWPLAAGPLPAWPPAAVPVSMASVTRRRGGRLRRMRRNQSQAATAAGI